MMSNDLHPSGDGKLIRTIRTHLKTTQQGLAEEFERAGLEGWNHQLISHLENGTRQLDETLRAELCNVLLRHALPADLSGLVEELRRGGQPPPGFFEELLSCVCQQRRTAIHGLPGVGKTYAAERLMLHPELKSQFTGMRFIHVGLAPALPEIQNEIEGFLSVKPGRQLLILDDIWTPEVGATLTNGIAARHPNAEVHIVYTTRHRDIAYDLVNHNERCLVERKVLPVNEAVPLLVAHMGTAHELFKPSELESLASVLECLPLTLIVAGSYIATSADPRLAYARLIKESSGPLLSRYILDRPGWAAAPTVLAVLQLSYDALPGDAQLHYRELAAFRANNSAISGEMLQAAWKLADIQPTLDCLFRGSLIQREYRKRRPVYRIHDLIRAHCLYLWNQGGAQS